jgi:hypothetical protein
MVFPPFSFYLLQKILGDPQHHLPRQLTLGNRQERRDPQGMTGGAHVLVLKDQVMHPFNRWVVKHVSSP